jgi:hypothetical protein
LDAQLSLVSMRLSLPERLVLVRLVQQQLVPERLAL